MGIEKIERVEKRKSRITPRVRERNRNERVAGRATPRVTARPTRLRASSWVSKAPDHAKRDKEVPCEKQKNARKTSPKEGEIRTSKNRKR